MPDDSALRSRRYRLHKAGDCSLCRHEPERSIPESSGVDLEGDIDPQTALEGLARRLAAAHERDPGNAALARELRITLQALAAAEPAAGDDPLEELRALAASVP